jgi:ABC-type phosphate transport system substrate-binding protein
METQAVSGFSNRSAYPDGLVNVEFSDNENSILETVTANENTIGLVSFMMAAARQKPCIKIRVPQNRNVDLVLSPRLLSKDADLFLINPTNVTCLPVRAAVLAYPLVGCLTVTLNTVAACTQLRTTAELFVESALLGSSFSTALLQVGSSPFSATTANAVHIASLAILCSTFPIAKAGGSSAMLPMVAEWTKAAGRRFGAVIQYPGGGSGAGRTGVRTGAFIAGGSDALVKQADLNVNPRLQMIPLIGLAASVTYNLGDNSIQLRIPRCALVAIFNGSITTWNHPALSAANPTVVLPNYAIEVVVRADSSGTTEVFTEGLVTLDSKCRGGPSTFTVSGLWPLTNNVTKIPGNDGVAVYLSKRYTIGYLTTPLQVSSGLSQATIVDEETRGESLASSLQIAQSLSTASVNPETLAVTLSYGADVVRGNRLGTVRQLRADPVKYCGTGSQPDQGSEMLWTIRLPEAKLCFQPERGRDRRNRSCGGRAPWVFPGCDHFASAELSRQL